MANFFAGVRLIFFSELATDSYLEYIHGKSAEKVILYITAEVGT